MFSSVIRFFKGSMLAAVLLAGLVGLAAGGALVLAGSHLVSTSTERTASNQGQANGHGTDVTSAVAKCKAALPAGQHGIGKCVSAVANQHGKAVSGSASQKNKTDDTQDADEPTPSPSPKKP